MLQCANVVAGEKRPTRALGSRDSGTEKGAEIHVQGKLKTSLGQALRRDRTVGQGDRSLGRARR